MITRTWPYGTRLQATIIDVVRRAGLQPRTPGFVELIDEKNEGHLIMGVTHCIEPKKGMRVEMRFTSGGPTGGFWKIIAELSPWFWTTDEEAEYWSAGGWSRDYAIHAARKDTPINEAPDGFWIAPSRRATAEDLNDWCSCETPEIGDWIVDEEKIEHLTPRQMILETVER